MKKFASLALVTAAATMGLAPTVVLAAGTSQSDQSATQEAKPKVKVNAGRMLYGPDGHRIASIYRVTREGNPQVILDSRMVTVPASSLSEVKGHLTTSISKHDLVYPK